MSWSHPWIPNPSPELLAAAAKVNEMAVAYKRDRTRYGDWVRANEEYETLVRKEAGVE